jgi:hypothetical protein
MLEAYGSSQALSLFPWPVAHACNPSYTGGRDQEDYSLKPAKANRSQDPILKKKPSQKRAGRVTQDVGPEFKPQYGKKKFISLNCSDT